MEEETIKILEPTEDVFKKANFYLDYIKKILPEAKVTLIGSLAIPVCVKNEIDILIEINEDDDVSKIQEKIKDADPDLFPVGPIDNGEGYSRTKKKYGLICELHILNKGDERIDKYLKQLERFKSNPDLVKKYGDLKRSLDGALSSEYKKAKSEFLQENGF